MILGRLPDIIKQYWVFIRERQWATWELLTIVAVAVVVLLLLMIALRRLREAGGMRRSARMIAGQPGLTANERIQLLQREIIKRDNTEARIETQISELSAANKQLRVKIGELTKVSDQLRQAGSRGELSAMQKMTELVIATEQLRQEATAGREARECSAREIAALAAANQRLQTQVTELAIANKQLEHQAGQARESSEQKIAELAAANKQLHIQVTELTSANEQLGHQAGQARESSEQKLADLAAANQQFQAQVAELTSANEQLGHQAGQTRESSEQKLADLAAANQQLQTQVTELTIANEQLQHQIEKTRKSSEEKNAALTFANEQLRGELAEYMKTGGKEIPDRHGGRVPPAETIMFMNGMSVKAKSPAQQLRELAEEIADSNTDSQDARRKAIQEACDYLNADNAARAVEALKEFISAVEAQQGSNGNISHKEEADDWIGAAREVIYQLTAE